VASLRALEELNVSANRLQMLPGQLFRLPKLHSLWAHSNQISRFPALLSAVKSLKVGKLQHSLLKQKFKKSWGKNK
jgi:Leucine-rich repeat (LRR) protein